MVKKAIGYLRVSDRAGTEYDLSIERQRRVIESWCVVNGYELERVEIDAGISGTRVRRPGLNTAMMYSKLMGQPIVVSSLDRIGRSYKVLDRIRRSKVEVVICDLPNSSALVADMLMAVAKSYSESVSSKMRSYHKDRAAKAECGEKTAHPVPSSRQWLENPENKKLMSDILVDARRERAAKRSESQLDLQKLLKSMQAEGKSTRVIAQELNEKGMKTARGCAWSHVAVHRILNANL